MTAQPPNEESPNLPDNLPPSINSVGLNKLAKMIKKMRIMDNSIIAVKSGTTMARSDTVAALVAKLSSMNKSVVVVVVDDMGDMSALNQVEMNKLGWFRVASLSRIAHVGTKKKARDNGDNVENES